MPTLQEIADNINAYNQDKIGHFNINTTDGKVFNNKIVGEHGGSYFDGVNDDIDDVNALSAQDYTTLQGLMDDDKQLNQRPC